MALVNYRLCRSFTILMTISFCISVIFCNQVNAKNINAISKSVFAHLAQPVTKQIQQNKFVYLPAGTRLIIDDVKTISYRGSKRFFAYSENGIACYVKDGLFYKPHNIASLKEKSSNWVFIIRNKDIIAEISPQVKIVIGFSRGEKFPFIEEDEDGFTVQIGDKKLLNLASNIKFNIKIPRKNAKLIDLNETLLINDINIFKLSIIDGIKGIKKPCNTKTVSATTKGVSGEVSANFNLTKFFNFLSAKGAIAASKETQKLEEFEKEMNVSREYYTRTGKQGIYKITRYKKCGGKQDNVYVITDPEIDELTINTEWAKDNDLAVDKRTGQVLVTCPNQYFAIYDALECRDFAEDEISFFVSQIAHFRNLTSSSCVEN